MPNSVPLWIELAKALHGVPLWVELAKALPSVVTAGTAIYGVHIAKAGLDKWRVETIGKRKAELAEQALIAFYEARQAFVSVRCRGFLDGEGGSWLPVGGESERLLEKRNTFYVPIERLSRDKEVFARLESLRYAFAAHFREANIEPFETITNIRNEISDSANILIQLTQEEDIDGATIQKSKESLLNMIGWGEARRPDTIDQEIDRAVQKIENVCRPILSVTD